MRHVRLAVLAGLFLLTASASPLQAQITVHTTFASWLASVTGAELDTFDDLDPDDGFLDTPAPRMAGAFSYVASAPEGMFPSGTVADPFLANYFLDDALTLGSFSPAAYGVAGEFFLTNRFGQLGVQGDLTVTVRSGTFTTIETLTAATTPRFLGFTGVDAITSLEIQAVDGRTNGSFATVNNFRLGGAPSSPVPEPSSVALLLAGVSGLVGVARRRVAPRPTA